MEESDIRIICHRHNLVCHQIKKVIGSFDKELFVVDDKYLIRTSKKPMITEQEKINRVKDLNLAPHILHSSAYIKNEKIHYLIMDYLSGEQLFSIIENLNDNEIVKISDEILSFLTQLHNIKADKYDIGHYITIVSSQDKWLAGHKKYWNYIVDGLRKLKLTDTQSHLLKTADEYIERNIGCLDYQQKPSLLHNDFHYKNIIISGDRVSGIIDWECSQFGEIDFDLIHLLYLSFFSTSNNMKKVFNTTFLSQMKQHHIFMIEKRLTIYMLEHDFIQLLWCCGSDKDVYTSRIKRYLNGELESYLANLVKTYL